MVGEAGTRARQGSATSTIRCTSNRIACIQERDSDYTRVMLSWIGRITTSARQVVSLGAVVLGAPILTPGWLADRTLARAAPAAHTPPVALTDARPARNLLPPGACIPRSQCCRICTNNSACGNWCSKAVFNCEKARGCACNENQICR